MQPFHYEIVEVFAKDGSGHVATLCNECAVKRGYDIDADEIAPIFADTEMDYYPECEDCYKEFTYMDLTEYAKNEMAIEREIDRELDREIEMEYNPIHGCMLPKLQPGEFRFK